MQDLITTISILSGFSFILMLLMGCTNKVVIFFDVKDFAVSVMVFASPIIGFIIALFYQHEGEMDMNNLSSAQTASLIISGLASIWFALWSMRLSMKHNGLFLGFFVGIFKILTSFLGSLVLCLQVGNFFSNSSNLRDRLLAIFVFGIFLWLGKRLINGKKVYINRGEPLLDSEVKT